MILTIDDITRGIFELYQPIENTEGNLKIGIKNSSYCVGFYNIYKHQTCTCRCGRSDENSDEFIIKPWSLHFQ